MYFLLFVIFISMSIKRNQNIFAVRFSHDLDEIIEEQKNKLVLVCFSTTTSKFFLENKLFLNKLARHNGDTFFVYIELEKFDDPKYKYIKDIETLPKYFIYYNGTKIVTVNNYNEQRLVGVYFEMKQKLYKETTPFIPLKTPQN